MGWKITASSWWKWRYYDEYGGFKVKNIIGDICLSPIFFISLHYNNIIYKKNNMEKNIIYNEDCFITMNDKIDKNSIDVVLTSPPYNMTKRKGGLSDTGRYDVYVDWMTEEQYVEFSINLFNNFDNIIKENGVVLYNLSFSKENGILPYLVMSEIYKNTNWTVVDTIIWEKNSGMPVPAEMRHSTRKCETIFVFGTKIL